MKSLEVFQKRLNPWRPLFFLGKRNFQLCYTYTLNFMEVLKKDFRLFSILIQICNPVLTLIFYGHSVQKLAMCCLLLHSFYCILFIWLCRMFVCGVRGLVPWAGTKPWPPMHWEDILTTGPPEVPHFSLFFLTSLFKSLNFWQVLVWACYSSCLHGK